MDLRKAIQESVGVLLSEVDRESWKVLVLDDAAQDVLAPVVNVSKLREYNVTLTLKLHDDSRQSIFDAVAVYLCSPTLQNVQRIIEDCHGDLYAAFSVCFLGHTGRDVMEAFGQRLSRPDIIPKLKVSDGNMLFVALESDLGILNVGHRANRDVSRNTPNNEETARGACSAALSMGMMHADVLYMRSASAAKEVAQKCATLLRDAVEIAHGETQTERSVVLILDRQHDAVTPLIHSFTYRGLLHDALGMRLNSLKLDDKTVNIFPEGDEFWNRNAGAYFGTVAESVEHVVKDFKEEADRIMGTGNNAADISSNVSQLVSQAPMLSDKRRRLETHSTLCRAVFEEVRVKQLDAFHGVEMDVVTGNPLDRTKFSALMESIDLPVVDKTRLISVILATAKADDARFAERFFSYLSPSLSGSTQQRNAREPSLSSANHNPPPDAYLTLHRIMVGPWANTSSTNSTVHEPSHAGNHYRHLFSWIRSGGVAQGLSRALAVGGLGSPALPSTPLAVFTASLVDGDPRAAAEVVNALRDGSGMGCGTRPAPITSHTGSGIQHSASRTYTRVCVVVVGGGSLEEYTELRRWGREAGIRLVYCCDELLTGAEYVARLEAMAH